MSPTQPLSTLHFIESTPHTDIHLVIWLFILNLSDIVLCDFNYYFYIVAIEFEFSISPCRRTRLFANFKCAVTLLLFEY